jgi:hypothetical protein
MLSINIVSPSSSDRTRARLSVRQLKESRDSTFVGGVPPLSVPDAAAFLAGVFREYGLMRWPDLNDITSSLSSF